MLLAVVGVALDASAENGTNEHIPKVVKIPVTY